MIPSQAAWQLRSILADCQKGTLDPGGEDFTRLEVFVNSIVEAAAKVAAVEIVLANMGDLIAKADAVIDAIGLVSDVSLGQKLALARAELLRSVSRAKLRHFQLGGGE